MRVVAKRLSIAVTLVVVMLGTMGTGSSEDCNPKPYGISRVGVTSDGIVAKATWSGYASTDEYYRSSDGGLTWSAIENPGTTKWASRSVESPRGKYYAEDRSFYLEEPEDVVQLVYSMDDLNSELDKWMLWRTDRAQSNLESRFYANVIAYDSASGNVIAPIGTQGALVGSMEGTWKPVSIGPYFVKRFTRSDYINAVFKSIDFWYVAVLFPLSFALLSMFLLSPFRAPVLSGPARGRYSAWELDLRYLLWGLPLSAGFVIFMSVKVYLFSSTGVDPFSGLSVVINFLSLLAGAIAAPAAIVLAYQRKWQFPWPLVIFTFGFGVATVVVAHLLWVNSELNADQVVQLVLVTCLGIFSGLVLLLIFRRPADYSLLDPVVAKAKLD